MGPYGKGEPGSWLLGLCISGMDTVMPFCGFQKISQVWETLRAADFLALGAGLCGLFCWYGHPWTLETDGPSFCPGTWGQVADVVEEKAGG